MAGRTIYFVVCWSESAGPEANGGNVVDAWRVMMVANSFDLTFDRVEQEKSGYPSAKVMHGAWSELHGLQMFPSHPGWDKDGHWEVWHRSEAKQALAERLHDEWLERVRYIVVDGVDLSQLLPVGSAIVEGGAS